MAAAPVRPEYVEYGGLGTAPGPLRCEGAILHGFFLPADVDALRSLCTRVFDEPSAGAVCVEPLLGAVMLTFGEIADILAGPPFRGRGRVTERQVAIWVPVLVRTTDRDGGEKVEIGAFIPYMWLDNPISIASGREIYGYPKTFGWATFPGEATRGVGDVTETPPGDCFQLDSFALRHYGPEERPGRTPLLRVRPLRERRPRERRVRGGLPRLATKLASRLPTEAARARMPADPAARTRLLVRLWSILPAALRKLLSRLTGRQLWIELLLGSGGRNVNQFFLRQFRSPQDGARASSQAIVRAPATTVGRPRIWLGEDYEIEIFEVASDPLRRELGIDSGGTIAEFRIEFDFEIRAGTELWP